LPQVSQQKAAVPGQHATSTSGVRAIFEEQAATIPPKSGLSEHAVESSSLEAWMRAVDEPARRSKALKIVEKAAAHFPKNPRILFYLGCLNALTDRPLKAERAMLRVLQLDPDHSEARRELEKLRRQGQERRRNSLFGRWGSRRSG
jgi:tetratricopeptide (TPR) repeat protein